MVWAFLVAQMVRIHLQCRRPWFESSVGNIPWRRDRLPTQVFMGFPGGSDSKESAWNAGDLGSIPGLGRYPGEGRGGPLQCSCLENPMGRGAWRAAVRGLQRARHAWATGTHHCHQTTAIGCHCRVLYSVDNYTMSTGIIFWLFYYKHCYE